jgi:hypothetical protein
MEVQAEGERESGRNAGGIARVELSTERRLQWGGKRAEAELIFKGGP